MGKKPDSTPETKIDPKPVSPPTPAKNRLTLSENTFGEDWPQILEVATHDHMNLATWLPHARPIRVDGDTLLLQLAHDQDLAKSIIEKSENRVIIDSALQKITDNITGFRVELLEDAPPSAARIQPTSTHGLPISEAVNLAEGKKALEDPNVAKVVEVFRGAIVDIQHQVKP